MNNIDKLYKLMYEDKYGLMIQLRLGQQFD